MSLLQCWSPESITEISINSSTLQETSPSNIRDQDDLNLLPSPRGSECDLDVQQNSKVALKQMDPFFTSVNGQVTSYTYTCISIFPMFFVIQSLEKTLRENPRANPDFGPLAWYFKHLQSSCEVAKNES